jgi:hypothetical protein
LPFSTLGWRLSRKKSCRLSVCNNLKILWSHLSFAWFSSCVFRWAIF